MQGPSVQSAGWRFLKKLSFSLVQALIFGGIVGGLVYLRAPDAEEVETGSGRVLGALREQLEKWELSTLDSRLVALGRHSQRAESVSVVAIDDETLAAGRQADDLRLAKQPWPRELLGALSSQLLEEGATQVLIDRVFADMSPHACPMPELSRLPTGEYETDDHAFRRQLDSRPGRSVLGFGWQEVTDPAPPSPLRPYLLYVGQARDLQAALGRIQLLLMERRPAYVLPAEQGVELWAAVKDDEEVRRLSPLWNLSGPPRVRELSAADRAHLFGPLELFIARSEVTVEGLDPKRLPRAYSVSHPVPVLLGGGSRFGSVELEADLDGRVRTFQHLVYLEDRDGKGHVLPSMPLVAAMDAADSRRLRFDGEQLHVGNRFSFPMDATGQSVLKWDAAEGEKTNGSLKNAVSAWRVVVNLQDRLSGILSRHDNNLKGKVAVLTHATHEGIWGRSTPIGRISTGAVIGQALANILRSDGITRASPELDALLTFGMAFLGAFLALSFSASIRSVTGAVLYVSIAVVAAIVYLLMARQVLLDGHLWLAVAGPVWALLLTFAATTVYVLKDERDVRNFINTVLGRNVAPEVARQVTRNVSLMKPERRQMSISFSDLEGFTRVSEQLKPEQLTELLNAYLSEMTHIVRRQRGHIDKYIGDAVMAFWGAPARTPRHAHLACESALRMRERVTELQPLWEARFGRRLAFRAGINSGDVVVGDMGSELKSNYTVVGEAVTLASRLERANKLYGTFILVGEETERLVRQDFVFREVDRIRVREDGLPVRIFELYSRTAELTEERRLRLLTFQSGLSAYQGRRFEQALPLFEQCATQFADPVAHVYVDRCRNHLQSPPPEDWDGTFTLREK